MVRAAAIYVVGLHKSDDAKAVAAAALKDADPLVRRRAAEALVRQGLSADKPSFAPVADVYALLNDADRFVRYSGRMALERTPRAEWAPKVLAETNPLGAIEGALALVETAKSGADIEPRPQRPARAAREAVTLGRRSAARAARVPARGDREQERDARR